MRHAPPPSIVCMKAASYRNGVRRCTNVLRCTTTAAVYAPAAVAGQAPRRSRACSARAGGVGVLHGRVRAGRRRRRVDVLVLMLVCMQARVRVRVRVWVRMRMRAQV
jgi:hypothetical protein